MSNDLEIVARCQFLPEAEAIRLHLEEHDIPVFFADAEIVNLDWFLGNAVGGIKVQVPVDRVAEALQLLTEMKVRARADDDEPDEDEEAYADDEYDAEGDADDEDDAADEEPQKTPSGTPCLSCGERLEPGVSTCASCGWSYDVAGAEPDEFDKPAEDAADDDAPYESAMNDLTYLKRPLFMVYLVPGFAILLLGMALLLRMMMGFDD